LLVGVVINLPGPFYLLALGKIAHGGYSTLVQVLLILLFNAIMFLLLEVRLSVTLCGQSRRLSGLRRCRVG
jgi:hypothetical protein